MQQNKLPKGWGLKKLGDVCEVKKGTSITKGKIINGTIPVIAGGQQPAYYHNTANRTGKIITLSASGAYAGFINYFEIPIFASDCTTIQSLDENKVLTKYIYLILKSKQKRIYLLQTGAGQPHVYAKDLIKIEISIPPFPIQKKIMSILEKAEKLKERRRKTSEETNKIIQSIFYEMFGDPIRNEKKWKLYELKQISQEIQSGFAFGKFNKVEGIPHLRPFNISKSGELIYDEIKYVPEDSIKNHKYLLDEGDVLFNSTNSEELVGKTALLSNNKKCTFSNHITKIRLKRDIINPYYFSKLFKEFYEKGQFKKMIKRWVNQVGIESKRMEQLGIPVPPIELQNKFSKQVKKIEKIKQHQQKSEQGINTLFDALVQKAFKGELVN